MIKQMMKISAVAACCLLMCQGTFAEAVFEDATEAVSESASENGVLTAIAGESGTTYENFFDVTLAEENYDLWYDCTAAIVGESAAADTVAFMQGYISSDLYGEEARAYYDANPDAMTVFDCFYINGLKLVTFNPDNTITVELENGSKETHSYEYLGVYTVGEGETMVYMGQEISIAFPCDVYKSTDDAGEFNYFFLRDDTMEETGHIEFRYGRDLEELQGYFTGDYGYWLTAGFDVNADEETLQNTVRLFCLENMDYSSHSEEALAQIEEFKGKWTADLSAFGDAYADTELYFTIDENGHGVTMMDGQQTADFEAYAYDNGEKGDGNGLYIAYSNLENEAEAAAYTLENDENGNTVLTLFADDGTISYVKDIEEDGETLEETATETDAADAEVIEIGSAEELAAINDNLSANYILTQDIDLGGAEWTPIGAFVPSGDEGEAQETPSPEYAFTGKFNGNGHTISNFVITGEDGFCVGLFGCIANAAVENLVVENADVEGTIMVSDVVGYTYCSTINDVSLLSGKVTAYASDMSAEGMYGGIAGAGMGSMLINCSASADITIPDNTANTGIVGGGMELTSLLNCSAAGSITAGNNCYGLGAVSGCAFGGEDILACSAKDVTITAGDNCSRIGGITGYAGGFEDESQGVPVTAVKDCEARFVTMTLGENGEGIGDIIGAGFYSPEAAEAYGAPYDEPTHYTLENCVVEKYVTE